MNKINTCQFHFKHCIKSLLAKIPGDMEELRNEVESLAYALSTVSTLNEYSQIKSRLLALRGVMPAIRSWINWWDTRRYHLFPVFRGYNISSLNMAEMGHSTLKPNKPIMLVDAAWEDTCTMILQEEELTKFLSGCGRSGGKGPHTASVAKTEKKETRKESKILQPAI